MSKPPHSVPRAPEAFPCAAVELQPPGGQGKQSQGAGWKVPCPPDFWPCLGHIFGFPRALLCERPWGPCQSATEALQEMPLVGPCRSWWQRPRTATPPLIRAQVFLCDFSGEPKTSCVFGAVFFPPSFIGYCEKGWCPQTRHQGSAVSAPRVWREAAACGVVVAAS